MGIYWVITYKYIYTFLVVPCDFFVYYKLYRIMIHQFLPTNYQIRENIILPPKVQILKSFNSSQRFESNEVKFEKNLWPKVEIRKISLRFSTFRLWKLKKWPFYWFSALETQNGKIIPSSNNPNTIFRVSNQVRTPIL